MPYCRKCGAKNVDDASFCMACGQPITDASSAENKEVPIFSPPGTTEQEVPKAKSIPTFTPPSDAFEPPVPTFKPPARSGPCCYYHADEDAVASCARCGKYICKDCVDNYGVTGGEYAGKALCYDCCQEIVSDNVKELTANKLKIKTQFIISCIGMGIGFILGFSVGIEDGFGSALLAGLLYACIGGVFLSAVKSFFSMIWEVIKIAFAGQFGLFTILSLTWGIIKLVCQCIWYTITNTIYYINYLKKTSGFIESDSACLQQMKDYMEYTLVRNQNRGVDIDTLLREESSLANNSYARLVQTQGEEQAEASIRNCVATINENGEIIRSFQTAA
jgi:hypothetical protein